MFLIVPRIAEFDGIVIAMYFRDHNPPHFHARYQGSEAQITINPVELLEGSLPSVQTKAVRRWATENTAMLQAAWVEMQGGQP